MTMFLLCLLLPCTCLLCAHAKKHEVINNIGIKMCDVKCTQSQFCRSFLYHIHSLTCRLSNLDLQNGNTEDGYIIVRKDKSKFLAKACSLLMCRPTDKCLVNHQGRTVCVEGNTVPNILGMSCKVNTDCPVKNFVCFARQCTCTPGFSFNPNNNTCARWCEAYGDESTIYGGLSIADHNERQFAVNSSKECSEYCVQETEFTCISYDYLVIPTTCTLSRYGYLDVPPEQRDKDMPFWYLGTRHCA